MKEQKQSSAVARRAASRVDAPPASPALPGEEASARPASRDAGPAFWEARHYRDFTPAEWESLCDGCGRCCVFRLEDDLTRRRFSTNVCCSLLDTEHCRCTDYARRSLRQPQCLRLTPEMLDEGTEWLPRSCAYRRVAEGRGLAWWHPLVSGTPQTVIDAGISVSGRVVPEHEADDLDQHIVDDWINEEPED